MYSWVFGRRWEDGDVGDVEARSCSAVRVEGVGEEEAEVKTATVERGKVPSFWVVVL